jgi:hypothetical protein
MALEAQPAESPTGTDTMNRNDVVVGPAPCELKDVMTPVKRETLAQRSSSQRRHCSATGVPSDRCPWLM